MPQSHNHFRMFRPLLSDRGSCWAALSENVRPAQKSLVEQRVLQMWPVEKHMSGYHCLHRLLDVGEFMDSCDLSRRPGRWGSGRDMTSWWEAEQDNTLPSLKVKFEDVRMWGCSAVLKPIQPGNAGACAAMIRRPAAPEVPSGWRVTLSHN